jgi:hypothetical protein
VLLSLNHVLLTPDRFTTPLLPLCGLRAAAPLLPPAVVGG